MLFFTCFSHSGFLSYFGFLQQRIPVSAMLTKEVIAGWEQELHLKSTQSNHHLYCCCPLRYLRAHIWLCGGRESSSHHSVTFLSSLHCSVTDLLHKLSGAWSASLWMLSKCFCSGEWGAQPPAVFHPSFRQVQRGRYKEESEGSERICTANTLQSNCGDHTEERLDHQVNSGDTHHAASLEHMHL